MDHDMLSHKLVDCIQTDRYEARECYKEINQKNSDGCNAPLNARTQTEQRTHTHSPLVSLSPSVVC